MSKRYVLLKDIISPDLIAKAGDIGIKKDSLYYDENNQVFFDNGRYFFYLRTILQYPDWFKEITDTQKEFDQPKTGVATFNDGFKFGVNWCKKYGIPNDDSTPPNPTKSVEVNGVKYLSPEEVLEREKKAFEAARKEKANTYYCDIPQFIFRNKYPTFENYKRDNP